MSFQEHVGRIQDFFEYAISYIEGFPEDDQMTAGRAVSVLARDVGSALNNQNDANIRHWLKLALDELNEAGASVDANKIVDAERHLKAGQTYFEDAVMNRKINVDFVIAPNGEAKQE